MNHVMRAWTFWIRAELRDECREHLENTKLPQLRAVPGNLRTAAIFRDLGDGTTEVVVASLWDSLDSIKAFAGPDYLKPSIDPGDKGKLLDRDVIVRHYSIDAMDADVFERALGSPLPL